MIERANQKDRLFFDYADLNDQMSSVTINLIAGEYYNIGGSYTCTVGDVLRTMIGMSPMKEQCRTNL